MRSEFAVSPLSVLENNGVHRVGSRPLRNHLSCGAGNTNLYVPLFEILATDAILTKDTKASRCDGKAISPYAEGAHDGLLAPLSGRGKSESGHALRAAADRESAAGQSAQLGEGGAGETAVLGSHPVRTKGCGMRKLPS